MNAHSSSAFSLTAVPEFKHHSRFDWGVIIYGGENPRTGFAQQPLEFNFFGRFYARRDIEQRAAEFCQQQHRTHYVIQEPADRNFIRGRA